MNVIDPEFGNKGRGATEDGATCCRAHKLHVFPYFITIGDIL